MKYKTIHILGLSCLLAIISCAQNEPRKPISYATGEYIKESVQRNKQMVADEERWIQAVIKKDSLHRYYSSNKGFWYKYNHAVQTDTLKPQFGDLLTIDFDVKDLEGNIIYTVEETQPKIYAVDKQEIMPGIRHAVKLMKVSESITCLFPSTVAYGYLGDKNKIGPNEPLQVTIHLKAINKES